MFQKATIVITEKVYFYLVFIIWFLRNIIKICSHQIFLNMHYTLKCYEYIIRIYSNNPLNWQLHNPTWSEYYPYISQVSCGLISEIDMSRVKGPSQCSKHAGSLPSEVNSEKRLPPSHLEEEPCSLMWRKHSRDMENRAVHFLSTF